MDQLKKKQSDGNAKSAIDKEYALIEKEIAVRNQLGYDKTKPVKDNSKTSSNINSKKQKELMKIVYSNYNGNKNITNSKVYTTNYERLDSNGQVVQSNGKDFIYVFTPEFENYLNSTVEDTVDNAVANSSVDISDEDANRMKEILPYIIMGMGASESSWCSKSQRAIDAGIGETQSYTGLTYGGLDAMNDNAYVTFGNYSCSTKVSDYASLNKSIKMSTEMYTHMIVSNLSGENTSVDDAFLEAEIQYAGGKTTLGAENCAAYHMAMMNEFYSQDNGQSMFRDSAGEFVSDAINSEIVKYDINNTPINISIVGVKDSDYEQIN